MLHPTKLTMVDGHTVLSSAVGEHRLQDSAILNTGNSHYLKICDITASGVPAALVKDITSTLEDGKLHLTLVGENHPILYLLYLSIENGFFIVHDISLYQHTVETNVFQYLGNRIAVLQSGYTIH